MLPWQSTTHLALVSFSSLPLPISSLSWSYISPLFLISIVPLSSYSFISLMEVGILLWQSATLLALVSFPSAPSSSSYIIPLSFLFPLSSVLYPLSSILYPLSSISYHLSSIIYHLSSIIYHLYSSISLMEVGMVLRRAGTCCKQHLSLVIAEWQDCYHIQQVGINLSSPFFSSFASCIFLLCLFSSLIFIIFDLFQM